MLRRGRVGRRSVLGGRRVARTDAVAGTTAVVARGVGRREDRRDDRRLAWTEGPVSQTAIDALTADQSQPLVVGFDPIERGAVLEAP